MSHSFHIFFLLGTIPADAYILDLRHCEVEVLDTANNEVVYVHVAIDPIKKKRDVRYEMLTIGNNIRFYGGYDNYQIDSVFMADPDFNPTKSEYVEWCRNFDEVRDQLVIYPNENKLEYLGAIFINYYRYTEPIPEIDRTIHEETQNILGHECTKATATWRGREWTAWFSDIPIDAGPWKFQGLPGLILKIEDSTGEHMIEAMGFKKDEYPFGYHTRLFCKTTREKYNNEFKDYCENSGKIIADSGMVFDTPENLNKLRKRRRFYAPIELE